MVLATAQQYSGFLGLAPVEQHLRVWTRFDTENVEVGTLDGERFEWPLRCVDATPYDTMTMELRLDGSVLYFVADNPLKFADEFSDILEHIDTTSQVTERRRSRSARPADPLDRRTTIPVFPSTGTAPPLRRSVDRERLVPLGRKGRLRKPKRHTHKWTLSDSTYGLTRYICDLCRHVTIDLNGPGASRPLVRR